MQNVCVCVKCHNNLELVELVNFRAGEGTKFYLRFLDCKSDLQENFYLTDQTSIVYDVNKSVLASKVISKGHAGLLKFCTVFCVSSPVTTFWFMDHVKVYQEKTFILRDENLKEAALRAQDLTIKGT